MKKILYIFFLLPLMAMECEDDLIEETEPQVLPEHTTEGLGTFGCLVNGDIFLPETCCTGLFTPEIPKLRSLFYPSDTNYFIGGLKRVRGEFNDRVAVSISDFEFIPKTYLLTNYSDSLMQNAGFYSKCIAFDDDGSSCTSLVHYDTNEKITGEFTVTYIDTARGILSGTFWYDAINNYGEVVQIRDGRFDVPVQF